MLNMHTLPLGDYQTNCYFIWADGSDSCAVIDPGYEPETVLLKARQLGKTVEAILLTHGHFDHVGGVKGVAEQTGCKVYICKDELGLPHRLTAGPLYHTHTYADGDVLEVAGLTLRVMQTPGHTAGSVCLLAQDSMFAGDTLFQSSCGRTDLPSGSWTEMRKSLQALRALDKNYAVYPGHGPSTTLDAERRWNPYMQAGSAG